jgi:hypothetical protein
MITRREAAIIGLYTGYTLGPFEDIHGLAEELIGHPIFTHQFASKILSKQLQDLVRPLYLALQIEGIHDTRTSS